MWEIATKTCWKWKHFFLSSFSKIWWWCIETCTGGGLSPKNKKEWVNVRALVPPGEQRRANTRTKSKTTKKRQVAGRRSQRALFVHQRQTDRTDRRADRQADRQACGRGPEPCLSPTRWLFERKPFAIRAWSEFPRRGSETRKCVRGGRDAHDLLPPASTSTTGRRCPE